MVVGFLIFCNVQITPYLSSVLCSMKIIIPILQIIKEVPANKWFHVSLIVCYRNILCQAHKQDKSIQNHTKTHPKQKSIWGSCAKKMWNESCWEYLHLRFSTPKDCLPCPMEQILVPFVQRFQYILKYFWEKKPALSYICISGASLWGSG